MTLRIYLDHAATTPMLPEVVAAVGEGMARWANPSSPHAEGRAARAALEEARSRIAEAYGWRHELLLTSGASESLAIAMGRAMRPARAITAVEHDAVMRLSEGAFVAPVDAGGLVDPAVLARPDALVCVQWANSETGVRQDIAAIAEAVHGAGSLLLVDAAQMPAGADPAVIEHADLVAVSAHKRGGPPGIGALLVRDLGVLSPTGGQERGYRPGTENLPGALGYAAAVSVAEPVSHYAELRAALDAAIVEGGGVIVGSGRRHPAIGAYRMPGVASAAQLIRFDGMGLAVSAGSACASGSLKPSHVLSAMGLDAEALKQVVRVSFGRGTTLAEVETFAKAWRTVARQAQRITI